MRFDPYLLDFEQRLLGLLEKCQKIGYISDSRS